MYFLLLFPFSSPKERKKKIINSIPLSIPTSVTPNDNQKRNSISFGVTSFVLSTQEAAKHEGNNRRRFGQVASIKRGFFPDQKYAKYTRGHTMLRLACEYWFSSFDVISPALCHQREGLRSNEFLVRTLK